MNGHTKHTLTIVAAILAVSVLTACQTATLGFKTDQATALPFLKNTPNECYYLDEFMPVPDGLVNGKSGSMNLRYYSYKAANYKDWQQKEIILSFYSKDDRCWSLFEEYYVR